MDYKNIAIDIYEKIQNIKESNSPIYEIAAELYKYESVRIYIGIFIIRIE